MVLEKWLQLCQSSINHIPVLIFSKALLVNTCICICTCVHTRYLHVHVQVLCTSAMCKQCFPKVSPTSAHACAQ